MLRPVGPAMEKIVLEPKPAWAETLRIRDTVLDELTRRGLSQDDAELGAMVATELSENAIKYGRFAATGPDDHFTVEVQLGGDGMIIRVLHPLGSPDNPNFVRLKTMIKWIKKFKDARKAYQERINAIAARNRKPGARQRGLGLVRIAYEGQAELDYDYSRGMLRISARCHLS